MSWLTKRDYGLLLMWPIITAKMYISQMGKKQSEDKRQKIHVPEKYNFYSILNSISIESSLFKE